MAKAKPLKERRKVWAKKVTRINLKLLKAHNLLRAFCHVKGCKGPNVCPQAWNHPRCSERLSIHTAICWKLKDQIHNVLTNTYEARYYLKNGDLGWVFYQLTKAERQIEVITGHLKLLYDATGLHSEMALEDRGEHEWVKFKRVIRDAYYNTDLRNTPWDVAQLKGVIKRAAEKNKAYDTTSYYWEE